MLILVAGLIVFLGVHSVRIVADDWRTRQIARIGEVPWKAIYALVSFVGLALVVWGYDATRTAPVDLWHPPVWTRHLASLITLASFILVAAAYIPRTRIKAAVGHPMVLGVKLWAVAHLLANGRLADIVLFGAFLVWAVLDYAAARRRDRAAGRTYPPAPGIARDAAAIVIGIGVWAAFAMHLHALLIGVRPFA
jgi:uncharacterized membrane protein